MDKKADGCLVFFKVLYQGKNLSFFLPITFFLRVNRKRILFPVSTALSLIFFISNRRSINDMTFFCNTSSPLTQFVMRTAFTGRWHVLHNLGSDMPTLSYETLQVGMLGATPGGSIRPART